MTPIVVAVDADSLTIITGGRTGDAALDTAISRAILQRTTEGDLTESLQLDTPHRVVAFGKHDAITEGFTDAVAVARSLGYDPTVRIAGGRAVAFSPSIIRFAWTVSTEDPASRMHERFSTLSNAVVRSLASFGIAASVGELPNEYCAGQYSVHILGHRKVMGVGQRLTRGAAQVGGMIVVAEPEAVNDVLIPIYAALGVPMDPEATGSVADERHVPVNDLIDALTGELAAGRPIRTDPVDADTLSLARNLRSDHEPEVLA